MKQITGSVVSTKMLKTVVIEVVRRWTHPLYAKTITRRKKYLAHNELPLKLGDKVIIHECRPLSKRKKWKVIKKI
ncbi:MAG: 30S ribosomal protein S17 [Candidatus Beckwithbacteria bacterium]|nr:30S ribosomal protein S17 [Candidatus Beckwithbacteria bacterium]